ncbi:hypothetical protein DXG03_006608, partial [Asterophora parasitica]
MYGLELVEEMLWMLFGLEDSMKMKYRLFGIEEVYRRAPILTTSIRDSAPEHLTLWAAITPFQPRHRYLKPDHFVFIGFVATLIASAYGFIDVARHIDGFIVTAAVVLSSLRGVDSDILQNTSDKVPANNEILADDTPVAVDKSKPRAKAKPRANAKAQRPVVH